MFSGGAVGPLPAHPGAGEGILGCTQVGKREDVDGEGGAKFGTELAKERGQDWGGEEVALVMTGWGGEGRQAPRTPGGRGWQWRGPGPVACISFTEAVRGSSPYSSRQAQAPLSVSALLPTVAGPHADRCPAEHPVEGVWCKRCSRDGT